MVTNQSRGSGPIRGPVDEFRAEDGTNHRLLPILFLRACRSRKRSEIMLSFKIPCCLRHGTKVQLLRNVQNVAAERWRNNGASIDRVDIRFGSSHPPGLEVRLDLLSLPNANRCR